VGQLSGPHDVLPDEHQPDGHRQRSYRWKDSAVSAGAARTLAQASLTDGSGRLYAYTTSSCLIFRP
jgi:hypothetical protein